MDKTQQYTESDVEKAYNALCDRLDYLEGRIKAIKNNSPLVRLDRCDTTGTKTNRVQKYVLKTTSEKINREFSLTDGVDSPTAARTIATMTDTTKSMTDGNYHFSVTFSDNTSPKDLVWTTGGAGKDAQEGGLDPAKRRGYAESKTDGGRLIASAETVGQKYSLTGLSATVTGVSVGVTGFSVTLNGISQVFRVLNTPVRGVDYSNTLYETKYSSVKSAQFGFWASFVTGIGSLVVAANADVSATEVDA